MQLSRALLFLTFLYFGPFFFIGSLICPGEAQGLGKVEPQEILSLAPEGEPGDPLWVDGVVFDASGENPLPGVVFRVYQTDASGVYQEETTDASNPRLQGWVRTDSEGRFEIRTIRPGPYPGGGVPAHIHFVFPRKGFRDSSFELMFAGDSELTTAAIEKSREQGRAGQIQPVLRGDDGIWRCSRDFKLPY